MSKKVTGGASVARGGPSQGEPTPGRVLVTQSRAGVRVNRRPAWGWKAHYLELWPAGEVRVVVLHLGFIRIQWGEVK